MKDGYYYFIPASADKTDVDKSLGYLCVTKYPKGASYSIQCSLSQEIAAKIGGQGLIEIFLSPTTYITAQSILIGKIFVAPKVRLFVDSSLQASAVNVFDEDQYAIITANGRTLCYRCWLKRKMRCLRRILCMKYRQNQRPCLSNKLRNSNNRCSNGVSQSPQM